jgi:hypothetical protein
MASNQFIRGCKLFQEQRLAGGQLAAPPVLHTRPAASLYGYHSFLSLIFPPSLLISESLQLRFVAQNLLLDLLRNTSLHPSSLLVAAAPTPCCTQDQLIYSSHLVFLTLVVVSANDVVFFLVVLIQVFCLLLINVSNSIVCY